MTRVKDRVRISVLNKSERHSSEWSNEILPHRLVGNSTDTQTSTVILWIAQFIQKSIHAAVARLTSKLRRYPCIRAVLNL